MVFKKKPTIEKKLLAYAIIYILLLIGIYWVISINFNRIIIAAVLSLIIMLMSYRTIINFLKEI